LLGLLGLGLGLVLFASAFAREAAGEPGRPASPANSTVPAASDRPKYLIFWSEPEKAGELAERVGMKGDGKTRLLGFGLPNATYELEAQLPNRIRSAFAAAREHGLAVMLHFDFHLAWKSRPDLWNWFDPQKPGYDPDNKYNVEWHGWDGPPNKVRYLNHGVLERQPPNMCFTSKRTRAEVTRIVSRVIGPVLREEMAKLQAEGKEALFAGVLVGLEPGIDDYSQPEPERTKMMQEDGVPAGPLGYRALLDRGFTANHPPDDFRQALANIVQEAVAFWCRQFVEAGIPAEKLYPHVAAPAPIEVMNAPIRTAFNQYSRPGWTTYAVEVLGQGFKPLYDELEQHGNPPWAGVEANAGMPGSVVDWETYLAWHYNHGCVLVGVNMGATGEDLPRRLWDSAFGKEAIAAYRKFLTAQPLAEKPLSRETPQIRIQGKMKQVRAGIERWQRNGRDPSAVGKLMERAQPLANGGKLQALEILVDQALEMLGETRPGMLPGTYGISNFSASEVGIGMDEVVFDQGLLRWKDTGAEVALFGVNYYPPFHWNYADLKAIGADHERTIREDLTHFRRLRLDLLRLHVFDREIGDRRGNLVDNDHLRLLDYLIDQAQRRGIYLVLTPIAWWAVPGQSDGISDAYPMPRMTTDPAAWTAEGRYLEQFLGHTNRYTGLTYAQDPAIVAIELINEPLYPPDITDAKITEYIDTLATRVRAAGCRKPIFYNGWGGHLSAVGQSSIEGCTFGWYPSGLVAGHALRRNFLPAVTDYPEMRSAALTGKAKGVYEFDAADVPGSYLYPAMARAFRCGGAQFAAQFQYDPLPLAPFNKGWQTHYLNLVYAPNKALSFMIAAEAFHRLPRLAEQRAYPANITFGVIRAGIPPEFRVSYEEDLSEHVSETAFLHSNTTHTRPPAAEKLERIVGCGSSPVVEYDGTGAYFLDRAAPGVWVLHVYPDAVWVNDPFGPDSFDREVSRVYWRSRPMRLSLPDLGGSFTVTSSATGRVETARDGAFTASPGAWILARPGAKPAFPPDHDFGFVAPPERLGLKPTVWHEPIPGAVAGKDLAIRVTAAARGSPQVSLRYRSDSERGWHGLLLHQEKPYVYAGTIPAASLRAGELAYHIRLYAEGSACWFPGPTAGPPTKGVEAEVAWLDNRAPYTVSVFATNAPIRLLTGKEKVHVEGQPGHRETVVQGKEGPALRVAVSGFGSPPSCVSWRVELGDRLQPWQDRLAGCKALRLRVRAGDTGTSAVELVLLEADGSPWGYNVPLTGSWQDVTVPLEKFQYFSHWKASTERGRPSDRFRPGSLQAINFCFGAWLFPERATENHDVEVEGVWLE